MIQANCVSKRFGTTLALDKLSCSISDGCIYGLVGSNGAGKSTFLRLISGVYKPDKGSVLCDGERIFDNPRVKSGIVFVPDDPYFSPHASMNDMARLYRAVYASFSAERFRSLTELFRLNPKASLTTFSKGMKRQAAIIAALSAMPKYLFFDETFDGLDPVVRTLVKKALYADAAERGTTVIISSHSLRELEDTCDRLALLHRGGIVLESDVQNLKSGLFKLQVGFSEPFGRDKFAGLNILDYKQHGSVVVIIVRGGDEGEEKTLAAIRAMRPVLLESLPLTLEEVFIYELSALGYSFDEFSI